MLTEKDVEIDVFPVPEDRDCMDYWANNSELEEVNYTSMCEDYESGNEWAWCTAVVRCTYEDPETEKEYVAEAAAGASSYKSRKDFIKNSGLYEEMVEECLGEIEAKLPKNKAMRPRRR